MEINITHFFETQDPSDFSASIAERGQNAGRETWANAKALAAEEPLLKPEDLDYFRDYMGGYGAWDKAERGAWTLNDANALLIQLISSDMREGSLDAYKPDWEKYEKDCEAGQCAGNIYKADDGRIYYSLGH